MIFNGIDLEQYFEDDFIVKDVRGRTITQNELETLSIPLANGEILIDSKIPPKVLEVDIALNANTKRDLNRKIDELNSIIHTKETVPIILKDEPDMTYYGILGTSKEDPEEANVHEATLNIMVLDGLKYGPLREIKLDAQTNKIYYAGTAPVIPEIEIIPSEKTTYAGYTNGEESVMVGIPMDVESMPYERTTKIFDQQLNDRTGWNNITQMYGINVGGSFTNGLPGMWPDDYGNGVSWHGPAVERVLNEGLIDFDLSIYVGMENYKETNRMGMLEWHLLSSDNELLMRIKFVDWFLGVNKSIVMIYIGNEVNYEEIRIMNGTEWVAMRGIVRVIKEGDNFNFYVAKTVPPPHYAIKSQMYIDTKGLFNKPVAKIRMAGCKYGGYPSAEPRFIEAKLRKINPPKEELIPYIADVGDSIVIDKSGTIYKNGEQTGGLDVSSVFFPLKKGENTLTVLPPNSDVTVRFREAFK